MVVVYLFHRDLRLPDHRGLEAAHKKAIELNTVILPLFVFTPEQVTSNRLKSVNSIQFMIASLQSLDRALKEKKSRLVCCYGNTVEVLNALNRKIGIECVIDVRDYTPYAKERIAALEKMSSASHIEYQCVGDSYLTEPGSVLNGSGRPYQKFTPFWTAAREHSVPHPTAASAGPFIVRSGGGKKTRSLRSYPMEVSLETMRRRLVPHPNEEIAVKGGREEGLGFAAQIPSNYETIHDIPSQSTSMLSAHLHFGTVSIREVYWAGKKKGLDAFVRQLYWREFYANIMDAFELLYKVHPYEFQKDHAVSDKQKEAFDKWCKGTTGVPLVDAGMKQMLRTGYMHNRVRLVVANWLVKDMHVHWRLGERFFAQHLVDYGLANNMMNWIWVASVLPFSQAPFRKVDAYKTADKFDPEGVYVKKWNNS
jgi:deoxyribodipyrimidine photo-lyase